MDSTYFGSIEWLVEDIELEVETDEINRILEQRLYLEKAIQNINETLKTGVLDVLDVDYDTSDILDELNNWEADEILDEKEFEKIDTKQIYSQESGIVPFYLLWKQKETDTIEYDNIRQKYVWKKKWLRYEKFRLKKWKADLEELEAITEVEVKELWLDNLDE